MVSKGWRSDLAQSDARAEARLFLSPSTASDEEEEDADDEGEWPPPRLMAVDNSADERRLCPFHLAVTPSTSAFFGTAERMCLLFDAANALPIRHNARQMRTLRLI